MTLSVAQAWGLVTSATSATAPIHLDTTRTLPLLNNVQREFECQCIFFDVAI